MNRRIRSAIILGCLLVATTVAAAPPVIGDLTISCLLPREHARVTAEIASETPIVWARVYFRSMNHDCTSSYVELRHVEGSTFAAILPKPLTNTASVDMRVAAMNEAGDRGVTAMKTVLVRDDCVLEPLSADDLRLARNIVVGLDEDSSPSIPCGFDCDRIVANILTNGDLRSADGCRRGPYWAPLALAAGGIALNEIIEDDPEPPVVSPARP